MGGVLKLRGDVLSPNGGILQNSKQGPDIIFLAMIIPRLFGVTMEGNNLTKQYLSNKITHLFLKSYNRVSYFLGEKNKTYNKRNLIPLCQFL